MSARVYFMKTVNGRKDVIIMSLQDEQWRRTSLLCHFLVLLSTIVCSQNTNKQIVNIEDENLSQWVSLYLIKELFENTISNLLGHPVEYIWYVLPFLFIPFPSINHNKLFHSFCIHKKRNMMKQAIHYSDLPGNISHKFMHLRKEPQKCITPKICSTIVNKI